MLDVGRVPLRHLHENNSETPDVHAGVVFVSQNQLGSHPVGSPDYSVPLLILENQLSGEAKVGQLDLSIPQEDVVALEVTMDAVQAMNVGKPLKNLQLIDQFSESGGPP